MKRILTASVAVLAMLTLAACGSQSVGTSNPAPTVTVTQQSTVVANGSDNESAFLASVRANAPVLESVPDSKLLTLGHTICTTLDNGASVDSVVQAALSSATSAEQAHALGVVIGASVVAFCPSHVDEVQAWLDAQSGTSA